MGQIVHTRHHLPAKRSRNDHADIFIDSIFQELNTFLGISEYVDDIYNVTKVSDSILAVSVVFIDVGIEPDQKNIRGHVYIDSTASFGIFFGTSR